MRIYFDEIVELLILEGVNRQFIPNTLTATQSGGKVSIRQIGSDVRLVGPIDFIRLKRENSSTFSTIEECMTYLTATFARRGTTNPVVSMLPPTGVLNQTVVFNGKYYVFSEDNTWHLLDHVISVAGKVGSVVLNNADVGLGNVDNTSDINKPISSAVQAALSLYVPNTELRRGFSFTASGMTIVNEKWPVISPYPFTVSIIRSKFVAGVAATGTSVFRFKRDGVEIGTATFAPSATIATLVFSDPAFVENDLIVIEPPLVPDDTLADIAFSIRN